MGQKTRFLIYILMFIGGFQDLLAETSRCYLSDLKFKYTVPPSTQTATSSGDKLNVICEEGYYANTKLPICEKGVWKGNTNESICKESDCQIPSILHGSLQEQILGQKYFNFNKFRHERKVHYETIPVGNTVPSTKVLYLFCEHPRTFQGTDHQIVSVQCYKGRWSPVPVCLRQGVIYIPTTTVKPRLTIPTTISLRSVTTSRGSYAPSEMGSTKAFSLSTTPSRVSTSLATEEIATPAVTDPTTENLEDQCSCYYSLDDSSVVAHANGKRLRLGDKVQNGAKIIFRCLHIGYHHLIGRTEITCADCQPWHSSDFPTCTEPKKGNVVVIYDESVTVLEDGALLINKGQNVHFSCIAMETAEYPRWNVPHAKRISFKRDFRERKEYEDILYQKHLYIQDADYSHAGTYSCFLKKNESTTFNVTVIDPDLRCPEFPNDSGLIITYEKDRQENSKAYFSCANKDQELVGEPVSTCLRTKEWSAPLPFCAVRCKKLKEFDYLAVQYTNNQEVGSLALFHCLAPGEHIEDSFAECLKNGSWSNPPPSCRDPDLHCPEFPNDNDLIITYEKDRQENSKAYFSCRDKNQKLVGEPVSTCLRTKEWSAPLPFCAVPCFGDPPEVENGRAVIIDKRHRAQVVRYRCDKGTKRSRIGNVRCLNGTWTGETPKCDFPVCLTKDLNFPNLVKPLQEYTKSSDSFDIVCKEGYGTITDAQVVTCIRGEWDITDDPCIEEYVSVSEGAPECRLNIEPSSHLQVQPLKDSYRFGETVVLSCPEGEELNNDVERLMCLGGELAWSDAIPSCITQLRSP